ncbi:tRNA 5-methoxyuridine(34)/uridine 5-oxyacetic acid(34) synthase CmoB [Methyloterricola oryzae]|uniref:tRNA 5-methoxyuridine(34)/uridine 5-oxyacetic acid(34) synthase CmoB n=1 Tax=Methyloterricola oryzae TaxID=1495050 RepID=UPI0009E5F515|nr:tRNA 5-methoxyuridine(34)/uridine 5-oxyacetic acid(34) synthase CmoB [Methyloterricola oryzae]
MLEYCSLFAASPPTRLKEWLQPLSVKCETALSPSAHGDLTRWLGILERLPSLPANRVDFTADAVEVGCSESCDPDLRIAIEALLRELHPWRKGPYRIHGIHIDTEWRSDLKWRRIAPHLQPLQGRVVLDVGCGNGYHAWRMLGAGARRVIGIDPTLLSVMQFHAIRHFAGDWPVHVLPLGIEDVPTDVAAFDSVFSMGVLYHRRSPMDHLLELKGLLRPGGELVLETLVLEGEGERVLVPEGRYAQMRNVWFIPTCQALAGWLKRCGFVQARLVDVSKTTGLEQRSTDWMRFQSLPDFLDPNDPGRTREGLPAPCRAVFLARKP